MDSHTRGALLMLATLSLGTGCTVLSEQSHNARAGENVFIVQGGLHDVAHRHAHLPTAQAIATPVEQALARAENAAGQFARERAQVAMAPHPTHPTHAMHAYRV